MQDGAGAGGCHHTYSSCLFVYTHDCMATTDSNIIVKFADNTAVVGLISTSDETAKCSEITYLTDCCRENNLELNASKTKEIKADFFKKQRGDASPQN